MNATNIISELDTINEQDLLDAITKAIAPLFDPQPEPAQAEQFFCFVPVAKYPVASSVTSVLDNL